MHKSATLSKFFGSKKKVFLFDSASLKRQLPSFIIHQKIHKNRRCLAGRRETRTVNFWILPSWRSALHGPVRSVSSFKIDQIDQIRPHIQFKKHTQNIKK